jgi:protease PrsW
MNDPSRIKPRKSLLTANIATFALLLIFVLVMYAIDKFIHPTFSHAGLLVSCIIIAIIPAIIWLGFYYRQDHLEPEPKGMVFQVFILGGLLAAAVGIPLINFQFHPISWMYQNIWVTILGSILVIGFTQEFLKYAAIRYSVFSSQEFDEPIDGIIYATSAGLGFATMLNITFVLDTNGVNLGVGSIRIVLTVLAQASFAGLTGYFLGKEKLSGWSPWMTLGGVSIAAILNGLFFYFHGLLNQPVINFEGGTINPWFGLILAALLSVGVTGILSWLIHKDQTTKSEIQEASYVN